MQLLNFAYKNKMYLAVAFWIFSSISLYFSVHISGENCRQLCAN